MTVEAIQDAIQHLPGAERRRLADWLEEMEAKAWDAEIERDFSHDGRGATFLEEVKREIAEGKARPMEEGFAPLRKPGR